MNNGGNILNTNGASCTSDTRLFLPIAIYARSEATSRPILAVSHHYVDVVTASCSNLLGSSWYLPFRFPQAHIPHSREPFWLQAPEFVAAPESVLCRLGLCQFVRIVVAEPRGEVRFHRHPENGLLRGQNIPGRALGMRLRVWIRQ